MRKLSFYLFSLLIVIGLAMSSCTEEENDPPTISVSPTSADAEIGDTVKFTVSVGSNANLTTLSTTTNSSIGFEDVTFDKGSYSESVEFKYPISTTGVSVDDVISLTWTITDDNKLTATADASITVISSGTAFATEFTSGKIYHISAPENASWDLAGDTDVSSTSENEPITYIQNNDATGEYTGKFQSQNSCGFVKVTLDYTTATVEEATAAYTGSSTTVDAVSANDVFVAMKGTELYLIKITDINDTDGTSTGGNLGSMSFSYKK